MRRFFANKAAIRLFVYTVLYAAAEIMRTLANKYSDNKHYGELFVVLEVLFAVLVLKNALSLILKWSENGDSPLKAFIKKFLEKVLAPIEELFRRKNHPNSIRVRGKDERTVMFPWKLSNLLKKRLDFREKINLKNCESNAEIIRMLYASMILKLNRNGYAVKETRTPREVKRDIKTMRDIRTMKIKAIFDIYEDVRYQKFPAPDDEAVRMCKEDEDIFG